MSMPGDDPIDPRRRGRRAAGPQDRTGRDVEAEVRARLFGGDASEPTAETTLEPTTPASGRHAALSRGTVVDRYVVLDKLGAGGMGIVYAAYDPELDRKLALKLVLPSKHSAEGGRARLLREAQALARLTHPNVVTVHDVGTHDDQVWIAMEFVSGQTLAAWARQGPRRWPELLRVLIEAGRGVAAAHAVGLVHRDLKPENVMLGRDGRVRVMDFGLAHGRAPGEADEELAESLPAEAATSAQSALAQTQPIDPQLRPELAALALRLTRVGSLQGTPAYMAPEQWRGEEATAAADQYGWSVMAWELLYGERPFAGEHALVLAANVLAGTRRPPRKGSGVPGWLRRALERGLAVAPAQRWPTMQELLATLERGRTRAWVRSAGAVLLALGMVAGGVIGHDRWQHARSVAACTAAGAEIEAEWNDATRTRMSAGFAASGRSYAATAFAKTTPWLDRWASGWSAAQTQACRNRTVDDVWDADLEARARDCLDMHRAEFASLLAEFHEPGPVVVDKAIVAAAGLRRPDECLDVAALRRTATPDDEQRARMGPVRAELARSSVLEASGQYDEARTVAESALAGARAIDWDPFIARASLQLGSLAERKSRFDDAESAIRAAFQAAARAGEDALMIDAANLMIFVVSSRNQKLEEGSAWATVAGGLLDRFGEQDDLRAADFLSNLSSLHHTRGSFAEARDAAAQALAIRRQILGEDHPGLQSTLNNLAIVHRNMGKFAEARDYGHQGLAIAERMLGGDHPDVMFSLLNLANIEWDTGETAAAIPLLERARDLAERVYGGDSPQVGRVLVTRGLVYQDRGELTRAQADLERAVDIQRRGQGSDSQEYVQALYNLAIVRKNLGLVDQARTDLLYVLAYWEEHLGPEHPNIAAVVEGLANLDVAAGMFASARTQSERSLAIREKKMGPEHRLVGRSLHNLGSILAAGGDHAAARTTLLRALTVTEKAMGPDSPDLVGILRDLGDAERSLGACGPAHEYYTRALELQRGKPDDAEAVASARGLGACLLAEGKPADAIPQLRRALAASDPDDGTTAAAALRFDLARALVAADQDRGAARQLAEAALASHRDGGRTPAAREIERWLAAARP